ncbi:hypothetical protein UlMin_032627 [Ulmus minor]
MGSAIHFPNLPFELILPTSSNNAKDIALKTIPLASKGSSMVYGFEIEKVMTLNMRGRRNIEGLFLQNQIIKKAYVTLKNPLSISSALYSTCSIEDEKGNTKRRSVSFPEKERSQSCNKGAKQLCSGS